MKDTSAQKDASTVSLKRIFFLLLPYKFSMMLVFLCIVVGSLLGIVPIALTQRIIDQSLPQHNISQLCLYSFLILVFATISGFMTILQNYMNSRVSQSIMADLREQLYSHLLLLPFRFFTQGKLGDLLSRFTNDINSIQSFIINTFVSLLSSTVVIVVTLLYMSSMNWMLAVVSIVIMPLFIIPLRPVGAKSRLLSLKTQEKLAEMGAFLVETLSTGSMLLIKNATSHYYEGDRFRRLSRDLMRLNIKQGMVGMWFFMATGLILQFGPVVIYLVGGLIVMGLLPGRVTIGEIIAFIALFNRLYSPTTQLTNIWVNIQRSQAYFCRIFALLDELPETRYLPEERVIQQGQKHIRFTGVSFAYEDGCPVLHDVSFEATPGQVVAIVGPSGAGKTTLTSLILRLYEVCSGVIAIDGLDIRTLNVHQLRQQIGIVSQDAYLYQASLRDNIAYGHPGATEDQVIAAAQTANIHDWIINLPQGYDTIVGERGYTISGGQRQRIALARVLLKNPPILILDEATSALDSSSESIIQEYLEPIFRQRTTLVIAHRLSTILSSDIILVMEKGHIVERGSHQQLLQVNGLYAQLYRKQFKGEQVFSRVEVSVKEDVLRSATFEYMHECNMVLDTTHDKE